MLADGNCKYLIRTHRRLWVLFISLIGGVLQHKGNKVEKSQSRRYAVMLNEEKADKSINRRL